MTDNRNQHPRDKKTLSGDIRDYVKKRADQQQEDKANDAKKSIEIQLLLSELENLLLKMPKSDPQVLAARQKLFDLKIAFYKTLDIK
jgi:hypothetical protein